jgi:DNA-binding MarR family transcriptional regulator
MGVSQTSSRGHARLALVTNPPSAASGAPAGVPAGLRLLRTLDRAVLEVAREVELRPMELYALILLSQPVRGSATPTRKLAEMLAASSSQAKQIALRLSARGLAVRSGSHGNTQLTAAGHALAEQAGELLEREIADRVSRIEAGALAGGSATIARLLSASA